MMICKICSHLERAAIDAALVGQQQTIRDIATKYGISRSAVDRHKKHIPKALTKAKQAETVAETTTLLSRVEKLAGRCESIIDKAEVAGKWNGAAAAARELRGCLELLAKLNGELQPGRVSIAINIGNVGGLIRSLIRMDVREIGDKELELLYGWLISDGSSRAAMSDAEIESELRQIARGDLNAPQLDGHIST